MALMLRILLLLVIATLVTGKNLPQDDPEYGDSENDAGSSLYDNDPGSSLFDDNEYDAGSSLYDNDPGSSLFDDNEYDAGSSLYDSENDPGSG